MGWQRHIVCFCLISALSLTVQNFAMAQIEAAGDAVMSTRSFRPIPDGSLIKVQIADDTDINLRLRDVTERALRRAGYRITTDKPAFTFRLETERLGAGTQLDRSVGSLRAGSGVGRPSGNIGGPQGTGVDFNLKLWSSSRNSVLNPQSSGTAPKQGFGIQLEAFDETAGKPSWHGASRAPDNGGDSFRTGSAIIRHLVGAIGLTLEAESISLR